jgi:hypothetical protein
MNRAISYDFNYECPYIDEHGKLHSMYRANTHDKTPKYNIKDKVIIREKFGYAFEGNLGIIVSIYDTEYGWQYSVDTKSIRGYLIMEEALELCKEEK